MRLNHSRILLVHKSTSHRVRSGGTFEEHCNSSETLGTQDQHTSRELLCRKAGLRAYAIVIASGARGIMEGQAEQAGLVPSQRRTLCGERSLLLWILL